MGVMVTSFNLLHRTIQCSVSARKFPRGCLKTRSSLNALERMFLRKGSKLAGTSTAKPHGMPESGNGNLKGCQCPTGPPKSSGPAKRGPEVRGRKASNFLGKGVVAQWLEHLLCKQDVEGSSPFDSTI